MQVNSISSFSLCQPRRMMNDTPNPQPTPVNQPEPTPVAKPEPETSEEKKSIYFGSKNDDGHKSARGLRKAGMIIALTPAALAALVSPGCTKDEPSAYASATANSSGCAVAIAKGGRDTVFIDRTKYDTVYVDTGSYHVSHDTIIQWKDNYVRPIPLDSLMKNLNSWDIDGTSGANIFDGKTRRNIIHYVGDREWEYNNREIGDMDVLNSTMNTLIYDVDIQNYKGNHLRYGKTIYRIPTSPFKLKTNDGRILNSPRGFFVETYNSPVKGADILDCTREKQFFCQTDANNNILRVYSKDEDGNFVEDGSASKGYLSNSSVLLKNLIGRYDTDDHLVGVEVVAVDDETLKDLYVRRRDDALAGNQ